MMKTILKFLVLLITIISCNNQNHDKENIKAKSQEPTIQEKNLLKAISVFPDSLLLREHLIQYYRENDDFEKAIATTDAALKKDSLNDRLWEIKGNLYFENYDTSNAIIAINRAADINPLPKYIIPLASMYAQTGDSIALQIADFIVQTRMTETPKESYFIKGLYYNFTGNKKLAIVYFDKCLSLDYNFMFAYREKAIALYDLGRYEDAIAVLDKSVTVQTKFDEGYYWLGRCLEKTNKPKDAIEEYKNALLITPDYVEAKDALTRLGVK